MPAQVDYELNLIPAEDAHGWTAMIYRMVRAGVCGPWTDTKPIPGSDQRMFWPLDELVEAALREVDPGNEYEAGTPEAYGRFGQVALRVPLTLREQRHMVPTIAPGGGLVWVDAGPVRH